MSTLAAETPLAVMRDPQRDRRLVRWWLYLVALMIVGIVVVGGTTRLTHSGLSITEWKPVHGVIPPLNDQEWQEEFAKYRQIPEFQLRTDMTLADFKGIFWWEWAHRLIGRLIGAVVLLPLIFLWVTGRIESVLKPRLVAILLLIGLQGAVGWWMVASGLSIRTDVSQYRLATHLTLGCLILAYVLWTARGIAPAYTPASGITRFGAGLIIAIALVQIFLGGLVAGLDAGLTFNTWPLMDGTLVPSGLFAGDPWWRNAFENVATVQFDHRLGGYTLFAVALLYAFAASRTPQASGAQRLAFLVLLQATLGVLTLLNMVPLQLALLHQLGAVIVLSYAVMHLRAMLPPLPVRVPFRGA
ncbi:MAG TPA: COX15/CtaA family protein [Bauldia sp.]|nr:COX15/CtaA family protein [Bauldia sp.]